MFKRYIQLFAVVALFNQIIKVHSINEEFRFHEWTVRLNGDLAYENLECVGILISPNYILTILTAKHGCTLGNFTIEFYHSKVLKGIRLRVHKVIYPPEDLVTSLKVGWHRQAKQMKNMVPVPFDTTILRIETVKVTPIGLLPEESLQEDNFSGMTQGLENKLETSIENPEFCYSVYPKNWHIYMDGPLCSKQFPYLCAKAKENHSLEDNMCLVINGLWLEFRVIPSDATSNKLI